MALFPDEFKDEKYLAEVQRDRAWRELRQVDAKCSSVIYQMDKVLLEDDIPEHIKTTLLNIRSQLYMAHRR